MFIAPYVASTAGRYAVKSDVIIDTPILYARLREDRCRVPFHVVAAVCA